eukprot:gene30935-38234_t
MDGDKDVLERRLREVIHLNNAQLNALQPLTFDQVIKHVNDRETAKESEARKSAGTISKLEKLKSGQTVKELDTHFASLVKKAQDLKKQQAADRVTKDALDEQKTSSSNSTNDENIVSVPQSLNSAVVHDLLDRPYTWGPWRVVMSHKLGRPFFFNTQTQIGQFAVPPELLLTVRPTDEEEEEEESQPIDALEHEVAHVAVKSQTKGSTPHATAITTRGDEDAEEEEEDTFIQSDAVLMEDDRHTLSTGVRSELSTQVDTSLLSSFSQHHMFSDPGFSAGTGTGSGFKLKRSRPDVSTVAAHDVERLFPGDCSDLDQSQSQSQSQQNGGKTKYSKSQLSALRSDSLQNSQGGSQQSTAGRGATQRDGVALTQRRTHQKQPEVFDMTQQEEEEVSQPVGKRDHKHSKKTAVEVMSVSEAQQQISHIEGAAPEGGGGGGGRSTRDRGKMAKPSRYREEEETNEEVESEVMASVVTESTTSSHGKKVSNQPPPVPLPQHTPSEEVSWQCGTCTYENLPHRSTCEMCGASNGRSPAGIASSKPKRSTQLQSQMMTQSALVSSIVGRAGTQGKSGTTSGGSSKNKKKKH